MDVLRRVRAFRRRPEKIVEASMSSPDVAGDLHLHHPAWYSSGGKSATAASTATSATGRCVSLISYEDLNSLSSAELGLVFRPTTADSSGSKSAYAGSHGSRCCDLRLQP